MFRFSRIRLLQFSASFIFAIAATSLAAQTTTIRGNVSDPSGAMIANAQVELLENGAPVYVSESRRVVL